MYTLIITQTREQAEALNLVLPPKTHEMKIEAYAYGHLLCGQNHYGKKPNNCVSLIELREDDKWFRQCLRPSLSHDATLTIAPCTKL